MAQRSHVPKFGNWESEDNVPYTVYFDKARKGRTGGKLINPNDPQENPDILASVMPPSQASPSRSRTEVEEPTRRGAAIPRRASGEYGEFRQSSDSLAHNDNMGRRVSGDSAHQRHGGRGSSSGQPQRRSADSMDRSPLHPYHQAKIVAKGSASPASEGKNSYDSSHGAAGRTRMRAANRGDETPDRGAAVPKFGEWDENNPSAADTYTHIFNQVREEKHSGAGKSPAVSNEPSYAAIRKQNPDGDTKICCFPWLRK